MSRCSDARSKKVPFELVPVVRRASRDNDDVTTAERVAAVGTKIDRITGTEAGTRSLGRGNGVTTGSRADASSVTRSVTGAMIASS